MLEVTPLDTGTSENGESVLTVNDTGTICNFALKWRTGNRGSGKAGFLFGKVLHTSIADLVAFAREEPFFGNYLDSPMLLNSAAPGGFTAAAADSAIANVQHHKRSTTHSGAVETSAPLYAEGPLPNLGVSGGGSGIGAPTIANQSRSSPNVVLERPSSSTTEVG